MKKRITAILKYLLFLGVGLGLVWWQVSNMTPAETDQFMESITHVRYIYVIPIIIMGLLSHYFRALRWTLLIAPIKKVSPVKAFYSTLIGYLGNTFIPRAGELLRCTMLGKYEKVAFSKLLGTVITERIFDLICYGFVIALTILVQLRAVRDFINGKAGQNAMGQTGISLWVKLLVFVVLIVFVFIFFRWLFRRFYANKYVLKIKQLWSGLKEGISTITHLQKKRAFIVYTLLMWAMYLLQIYLGFRTIQVTQELGLGAALSVLTLSTLAMIISPGGLGAFPVAIQQVLLVYHINDISFGWLVWGVNTAIIILAGLVSLVLLTKGKRLRTTASQRPAGETS